MLPRLIAKLERGRGKGGPRPVRAVHRLDRETSGLMVFARTAKAQKHLEHQFRRHTVQRRYLAIVEGGDPGRVLDREPAGAQTAAMVGAAAPRCRRWANGPSPTFGPWNGWAITRWWNVAWKRVGRTKSASTWPRAAIRFAAIRCIGLRCSGQPRATAAATAAGALRGGIRLHPPGQRATSCTSRCRCRAIWPNSWRSCGRWPS